MKTQIKSAIIKASELYSIKPDEVFQLISNIELRELRELRFSPYLNLMNMLSEPESWYIKSEMSSTNTGTYSYEKTKEIKLPKFQIVYGSEFGIFGIPIYMHKEYGFKTKYKLYRVLNYSYFNQAIVFISYNIRNKVLHVIK